MKKLLIIIICAISFLNTNAQKGNSDSKIGFNVGAEIATTTGSLKNTYSIGLGATANLEYTIDEKKSAFVNSGIIQYVGRKTTSGQKNRNTAVFPIIGGVKYYFANNFYGSAALGVSIFSGSGAQSTKFTYAPGIGFKANEKYDILFKYTGYAGSGGAFGVRVSYKL